MIRSRFRSPAGMPGAPFLAPLRCRCGRRFVFSVTMAPMSGADDPDAQKRSVDSALEPVA